MCELIQPAISLFSNGQADQAVELLDSQVYNSPFSENQQLLKAHIGLAAGKTNTALDATARVLEQSPHSEHAWLLRTLACAFAGHIELNQCIDDWLVRNPDSSSAMFFRDATRNEIPPDRAPAEHVRQLFDFQAPWYDATCSACNYQGKTILADLLANARVEKGEDLKVLDAGCGSGLLAPVLREYAGELVGVDLSDGLLQIAATTSMYDFLQEADLPEFLANHQEEFDLINVVNCLQSFGDLTMLMTKLFGSLRENGVLVLGVEMGPLEGDTWFLQPTGNYVHSPSYLIEQLGEQGVAGGSIRRSNLSSFSGREVFSLVAAVQRP